MITVTYSREGGPTLISDDALVRLRVLVTNLQDAPSSKMPDWKRAQQDGYSMGFDDGQIQAGNDLEMLLDDLTGIKPRPDA